MVESSATEWFDLKNPATQEIIGKVPQSTHEEVFCFVFLEEVLFS